MCADPAKSMGIIASKARSSPESRAYRQVLGKVFGLTSAIETSGFYLLVQGSGGFPWQKMGHLEPEFVGWCSRCLLTKSFSAVRRRCFACGSVWRKYARRMYRFCCWEHRVQGKKLLLNGSTPALAPETGHS